MTIAEAIKYLEERRTWSARRGDVQHVRAIGYGVEALRLLEGADFVGGPHTFKGKGVEECIFIRKADVRDSSFISLIA